MSKPIEEISQPILFINGEFDELFSISYIKTLYDRISHNRKKLKIPKEPAHLIFQENANTITKEITSFLTEFF